METRRGGDRPGILIVDDHEISARHAMASLAMLPADLRLATTGESALRIARSWPPALVILDFRLPDMDGLTVARKMKQEKPPACTPIECILLSAEVMEERRSEMAGLGIRHALRKPVSGEQLRALASEKLGLQQTTAPTVELQQRLGKLFVAELKIRMPELERHLLNSEHGQAALLAHQLIASSAMTGEARLEKCFTSLCRLLQGPAEPAELARACHEAFHAARAYLERAG